MDDDEDDGAAAAVAVSAAEEDDDIAAVTLSATWTAMVFFNPIGCDVCCAVSMCKRVAPLSGCAAVGSFFGFWSVIGDVSGRQKKTYLNS